MGVVLVNQLNLNEKIFRTRLSMLPPCCSADAGVVDFKLISDGTFTGLVKFFNREFKEDFRTPDFKQMVAKLTDELNVHLTLCVFKGNRLESFSSKCIGQCHPRTFVKKKKRKSEDRDSEERDLFLGIVCFGTEYKYYVLRVKRVHILCPRCKQVYSSQGHDCETICKQISKRPFNMLTEKKFCVDIFYDIETFQNDVSDVFWCGLVAFCFRVRFANRESFPLERVAGEDETLQLTTEGYVRSILQHYAVPSCEGCYYLLNESLSENDDLLNSFLDLLSNLVKLVSENNSPYNTRMSLVSFNGNKFDDFFLFKSLVKRKQFCGLDLSKVSVLERGSKLLCISFRKEQKSDAGTKHFEFRTHDLRNFLSTGSLRANAVKFDLDVRKTYFPHGLISHLKKSGINDWILPSFPAKEFYREVMEGECRCEVRDSKCASCFEELYNSAKDEHGSGAFDVRNYWITYCCMDVEVTKKLYYKFADVLVECFREVIGAKSFDPYSKITLPSLTNSLAYKYSCGSFGDVFYTPLSDYLSHTFKAVYGGHCQTNAIGELDRPEDYIFFDFNGEYSGLMTGPLPCGKMRRVSPGEILELNRQIDHHWREKKEHMRAVCPFICKTKLTAPRDSKMHFDLPNVPGRDAEGFLEWSNKSKIGVYSSIDVYVAVRFYDYKAEILYDPNNYVMEVWKPLLRDYVVFCQELKKKGKQEKNKAKENVGKLMGNALYGFQIKKPDVDKMEYVNNKSKFLQLRLQEQSGFLKINNVCPVKDIANFFSKPVFSLSRADVEPYDNGYDLVCRDDYRFDYVENPSEGERRFIENLQSEDFPLYAKYTVSDAFEIFSNTLPQIGVYVLSYSRLLNALLYFNVLISPRELEIPLESREVVVLYTDTDSFLVKRNRVPEAFECNLNVGFVEETDSFTFYGKNELTFVPSLIMIAGKKLYICVGDLSKGEIKTASKGVDKNEVTVERFRDLIENKRVTFSQNSFKKNFNTYDIEHTCILRELGLTELKMIPVKKTSKCTYYRPLNDDDVCNTE